MVGAFVSPSSLVTCDQDVNTYSYVSASQRLVDVRCRNDAVDAELGLETPRKGGCLMAPGIKADEIAAVERHTRAVDENFMAVGQSKALLYYFANCKAL